MTRLLVIAAGAYVAGAAIGTGVCWAAVTRTTHEHRYRIGRNWI